MRVLWDFLLIVSIGVWILGLTADGHLSPRQAVLFLIGLVFFIAMIKRGGSLGRLIRWVFSFSLPIFFLLTFVTVYGKGDFRQMGDLLASSMVLFVMLFGFYVMFGGLFRRKK